MRYALLHPGETLVSHETWILQIFDIEPEDELVPAPPPPGFHLPPTLSRPFRRLPARYRDVLPSAPAPASSAAQPSTSDHDNRVPVPSSSNQTEFEGSAPVDLPSFQTAPNSFGLYKVYTGQVPSYDPDEDFSLASVSDAPGLSVPAQPSKRPMSIFGSISQTINKNIIAPFLNKTAFYLMQWFYNGTTTKSLADLDRLRDAILEPDFSREDLRNFSASREAQRLDQHTEDPNFSAADGWQKASVQIPLPPPSKKKGKWPGEQKAPVLEVANVYYRRPLEVIKAAFTDAVVLTYHLAPHQLYWKPSEDFIPEEVHSQIYHSRAVHREHKKILREKPNPLVGVLETVIVMGLLWSDSTHVAHFGDASLWPIYLYFGNQSKYTRGKPSSFAAHHLAYLPSVCLFFYLCSISAHWLMYSFLYPGKRHTCMLMASRHLHRQKPISGVNLSMLSGS